MPHVWVRATHPGAEAEFKKSFAPVMAFSESAMVPSRRLYHLLKEQVCKRNEEWMTADSGGGGGGGTGGRSPKSKFGC